MAEDFKLPGSSYAELVKIIRAYNHASATATLADVARLAAIDPTIVSRNNSFLVATGILDEGRQKAVSPLGRGLGQALEFAMTDEVARAWRDVIEGNDFLGKLVVAVRIRGGMENTNLQAHIAYSAGQRKSPAVMTGARTVIEILKQAGLIKEDDGGRLVAVSSPDFGSAPRPVIPPTTPTQHSEESTHQLYPASGSSVQPSGESPPVAINIQIQCSPDDLDELADQILVFLAKLRGVDSEVRSQE